jgi:transposase
MAQHCFAMNANINGISAIMVGNRRHIPEAAKQQWVTMSAHMKSSDIAHVTHSNHRTINCALRLSRLTGSVIQKPLQAGRPRQLTAHDVAVSHNLLLPTGKFITLPSQYLEACIERTPDIYLHELQHALWEGRDVDVSLVTIDRMLHRHGYSRRKVNLNQGTFLLSIDQNCA